MKKPFQSLVLTALCTLPANAFANNVTVEELFRLHDCEQIDGQVILDTEIITANFPKVGIRALPLAPDAVMMRSPDTNTHLCLLYDAFGDREITAILTPTTRQFTKLK